jgi:putative spermidine/putrescine transport system permease protein
MKNILLPPLLILMLIPLFVLIFATLGTTWEYPQLLPFWDFSRSLPLLKEAVQGAVGPTLSSLYYSIGTVFLTIILTIIPARYLAYADFKGIELLKTILILPAVISPFTYLMGIQFIFLKIGLGNSYAGVILVLTIVSYPYMLRVLLSGYERFDRDYYRCARNLGASPLRAILLSEAPLIIPSLVAGSNIVFLVAFSDYFLVFLMGGARIKSLALTIFPLLTTSSRNVVSLYNLIFLIIPLLLFVLTDWMALGYYRKRKISQ